MRALSFLPIALLGLGLSGLSVACGDDVPSGSGGSDGASTGASTTGSEAQGSTGTDGAGGGEAFGEDDVVAAFATFTTQGFVRITDEPTDTQHGVADAVAIWVSDAAVTQYLDIDPTDPDDTTTPFPEGTIIVKQNYDAAGAATGGATVLAKMAGGFAPDSGDWWWGRFGDDGSLAESGSIGYCIACHEGNGLPRTDWVQGVPADNRLP